MQELNLLDPKLAFLSGLDVSLGVCGIHVKYGFGACASSLRGMPGRGGIWLLLKALALKIV